MPFRRLALALALCAAPAFAQDSLGQVEGEARAAADRLIAVGDQLEAATLARDRIAALTSTVQAYEDGLMSLRAGLRQVTLRERAMSADLNARRQEVAGLLGALATMERAPGPLLLLHPSGPIGTARTGQMIADVTPALQAEVTALRAQVETLASLRSLQQTSVETLREGLRGVQIARTELGAALAERRALPQRFVNDREAMAALVNNADTLQGFADGLGDLPPSADTPTPRTLTDLPLPVAGRLLRRFEQADAAGIRRPGWLLATPAGALVSAPVGGTLRYAGPLLDYGRVIILEPGRDQLLVLAGMAEVYGEPGDIIAPGAPLGLMGGTPPGTDDFLIELNRSAGLVSPETLYIETRESGTPVDPGAWFAGSER